MEKMVVVEMSNLAEHMTLTSTQPQILTKVNKNTSSSLKRT